MVTSQRTSPSLWFGVSCQSKLFLEVSTLVAGGNVSSVSLDMCFANDLSSSMSRIQTKHIDKRYFREQERAQENEASLCFGSTQPNELQARSPILQQVIRAAAEREDWRLRVPVVLSTLLQHFDAR